MADIVLSSPFPFASGDSPDAGDVFRLFYRDQTVVDSLLAINGTLDEDNFDASFLVRNHHTQKGSHVDSGSVAGTANLDYKGSVYGLFNGYDSSPAFDPDGSTPFQYIPGAGQPIYCKWPAYVLAMWQVYSTPANYFLSSQKFSQIFLTVDGEYEPSFVRMWPVIGDQAYGTVSRREGVFDPVLTYEKARYWSGAALLELSQGWHDVGLAVVADFAIMMTRIHAVSFKHVAFKRAGGV